MADINFDCPFCKQNLDAPDDMTGMSIECPSCGKAIRVPAPLHIHYPIKKTLGPQPASGAKIFASKIEPPATGVTGEVPPSDDLRVKTTKIEVPPDLIDLTPKHSRIIVIKRPGK